MGIYVVYLTMYSGVKLPHWYVGSSTSENVKNGYNGSVRSERWKEIYYIEQKENKNLFKTRILSYHETREDALAEELRIQKLHNVVKNIKYFNESYATINGYFGKNVSGELNPFYGKKHTQETINHIQEKFNEMDENGITTREKANQKMIKTKNTICDNGLTLSQNASIKGANTRTTKILDNGLSVAQDNAQKGVRTKINTVLDNGLNILQDASRKCLVTKRNTFLENGLTIEEATSLKISETVKTTILENGLSIAQNRAIAAAETKTNTILENGLNINQNSAIKQSQTKLSKEWKETIGAESHRKTSETLKKKPILTCPHCMFETNSVGNMKRWHFDNCKKYKGIIDATV